MTQTQSPQAGIADALTQLSEDTRLLVRQEIDSARQEMWEKGKQLAPGAALLGAAGLLGVFSAASVYRFALRFMEKLLPPTLAALFAAGGLGALAAYSATQGVERIRGLPAPVPSETVKQAATGVREAVPVSVG